MNREQTQSLVREVIVPRGTELPPPPPGVRYVSVPMLGIVIADDHVRRRVHRRFHWPMIILALFVLPVLAVELFFNPAPGSTLWWAIWVSFTIIWLAFTIEFVIKVAIAESRLEYAKRNWLDIVIIVIPVLRPLRAATIARTTRVFTLRGVGMKLARYIFTIVIGLEATERLLHRLGLKLKDGRRPPEKMTRHELMKEVKKLRRLADRWDEWYDAHQIYFDKHGHEPFHRARPTLPADGGETAQTASDVVPEPAPDAGREPPATSATTTTFDEGGQSRWESRSSRN